MAFTQNIKFSNNASTNISSSISAIDTSITLTPGAEALFPSISTGSEYFYITISDGVSYEIAKCTNLVGNTMTVVRGQDGTTARAWLQNFTVSLRLPRVAINDVITALSSYTDSAISSGWATPGTIGSTTPNTGAFSSVTTNTVQTSTSGLNLTAGSGTLTLTGATVLADGAIDINSGAIDGATIGASNPSTGTFTSVTVRGTTVLGDASTDTLTIAGDTITWSGTAVTNTYGGSVSFISPSTITLNGTSGVTFTDDVITAAAGLTVNTDQFVLDSSGRVGIGKTAHASYLVDVDGTLNATELRIGGVVVGTGASWTDVGVGNIYRNSSVHIGGTADPTSTLQVTGTFAVSGNTTIGDAAGDTLTVAPNAVTWSNNPTHSGNHTFSGNLVVNGNTTIGNAAGDTLTIAPNAVTWSNNPTHSGNHTYSGIIYAANGAAATPSIALTNSTTTGLFRVGADHIGIATAGTSRVEINSSGLVGVGMTPATYAVNVNGTVNATEIRVGGAVLTPGSGSNWTVTGADVYRGAGAVYINTNTNPSAYTLYNNGTLGVVGSITVEGTGRRFLVHTNDATHSNRFLFQDSVSNSDTNIGVIPNGTGTVAALTVFGNSTPTNCALGQLYTNNSEVSIRSSVVGTGTYVPITFYTSGFDRGRINTNGEFLIGTSTDSGDYKLQVSGNAYVSGTLGRTITTITSNTTLAATHHYVLVDATSGNITVTLPAANLLATSGIGLEYRVKRIDTSTNTVKVKNTGSDTTDNVNLDGTTNYISMSANESIDFVADGTTKWYMF